MPPTIKFVFPFHQFLLGQMVDGKFIVETKHNLMVVTTTIAYVCVEVVLEENEKIEKTIHQHTVVIKSSNEPFIIKDGDEFPFHISVPIDLPPTIKNDCVSIEHRFIATVVKAKTTSFFGQKKLEEHIIVDMLYPHLSGLSYFTKRHEFSVEGYSLSVNLERDIYSLGQNLRVNYLLEGSAEKDVQLPLLMSLVRTFTNRSTGEMAVITKHDDHIRINQPISLEITVPNTICPTVKSAISEVNVEYSLIVSVDMLSLCCKRIQIEGKIPILITDMQQSSKSNFNEIGTLITPNEFNENYKEQLNSVLNNYQMVLQTLLDMKFYKDFVVPDCPNRRMFNINQYISLVKEILESILSLVINPVTWRDSTTLLPNYCSIRKMTRMFQVAIHFSVNLILLIPPTALRTSIYVNCLQTLNCYQNLLYHLYMKKKSIEESIEELRKSISHYLECIIEADEDKWVVELDEFRKWLNGLTLESIPINTTIPKENIMDQLKPLFHEVPNLLYNIRMACDTVSLEGLKDLIAIFKTKVISFIGLIQGLITDERSKEFLRCQFINFNRGLESYVERAEVLSFEPTYRTEKYWDYSKTVLSMWNIVSIVIEDNPINNNNDYFLIYQCGMENDNFVIRGENGIIVENPCIYCVYKDGLSSIIKEGIYRLKTNYSDFIEMHSKDFLMVFSKFLHLLSASYLHPNVFSKFVNQFQIKQRDVQLFNPLKELFIRIENFIQKLIIFYRINTSRDPTSIVYDTCHAQKRVVEQLMVLVRLCLLHGQIYSPIYVQMIDEFQKFREMVYGLLLRQFHRLNEEVKHSNAIDDEIQGSFFGAKQRQVVYTLLFEEHVDCSESADIPIQIKELEEEVVSSAEEF
ncbi:hypothetical protein KM1_041060 [Entamoeba histolytica HM-3:IMSS]|nr:hypothetical protein KM1_041060 [Entamoeba histolytica HM-3:IMSS]GAT97981.1 hypothetical protein CL6EHI_053460 [Entamoeba histolytica]